MELLNMPLFPLGNITFPGFSLELHIFEPRYRSLVADCVAGAHRFGVLGIEHGIEVGGEAKPYMVGTLMEISELHELPDGRFYMGALGLERIRVLELDEESKPYLSGRVSLWLDEDRPPAPRELVARAGGLFNDYLSRLVAAAGKETEEISIHLPLDLPADPRTRSLLISALMQVSAHEKQQLLEAPSPGARLEVACGLLVRELALMRTTHAAPAANPAFLRGAFSEN